MNGARAGHPPRRSLAYLGVGMVALAAVGLVLARGAIPVLAALAVLFAGGRLVRAGASATPRAPGGGPGALSFLRRLRANRALWIAGALLAAGTAASYWLVSDDQAHGGHAVWPLYLFAGFALAGAVVWSILGTSLMQR